MQFSYNFGNLLTAVRQNGSSRPLAEVIHLADVILEQNDYHVFGGRINSQSLPTWSRNRYHFNGNNPVNYVDPDEKAIETLWDIASVVSGVKNLIGNVRDGNYKAAFGDGVGIAIDAAAMLVPGVPGGVGAIRAGAKVVDTVDDVVDAAKAGKAVGNTATAINAVHGNSRLSTKAQHAYDIIDTETKTYVKTGVSGGRVRKDGKSYRAEQQVRQWNEQENTTKYKSEITHIEPEGVGARDRILDYEKQRANMLRQIKQLDGNKHIRP